MKKTILVLATIMALPGCAVRPGDFTQADYQSYVKPMDSKIDTLIHGMKGCDQFKELTDMTKAYTINGNIVIGLGLFDISGATLGRALYKLKECRDDEERAQEAAAYIKKQAAIEAAKTPEQRKKEQEWAAFRAHKQCEANFKNRYMNYQYGLYDFDKQLTQVTTNPQQYSSEASWREVIRSIIAQREEYRKTVVEPDLKNAASCLKK